MWANYLRLLTCLLIDKMGQETYMQGIIPQETTFNIQEARPGSPAHGTLNTNPVQEVLFSSIQRWKLGLREGK